jgi:hypothetical protein
VKGSPVSRGCADRGGDIVRIARVGNGGRAAIDRAVPAYAGAVVIGVGRLDEAADEPGRAQLGGEW